MVRKVLDSSCTVPDLTDGGRRLQRSNSKMAPGLDCYQTRKGNASGTCNAPGKHSIGQFMVRLTLVIYILEITTNNHADTANPILQP